MPGRQRAGPGAHSVSPELRDTGYRGSKPEKGDCVHYGKKREGKTTRVLAGDNVLLLSMSAWQERLECDPEQITWLGLKSNSQL